MRTSSYVIYVDLPDNTEDMLLIHGYTGAFDRVGRRVSTYLRRQEAGHVPKPLHGDWSDYDAGHEPCEPPDADVIDLLRERGYLTELSVEAEEHFLVENLDRWHLARAMNAPQFIFMPTYDCNLRCAYCFQDSMRTDSRRKHLLRTMSTQVVDRIFSAIPRIEALHGLHPDRRPFRSIGFFGGEPLLARSRDTVAYIMERAKATGDNSFWAVTNATELDAYDDLLGPDGIGVLQITLDGPPAEHDRRRIYPDGSGSFDRIAANLHMALDRGAHVQVRVNVDKDNLADLPALARTMIAEGWDTRPGFSAYAAVINPTTANVDAGNTLNTWTLRQELERLREHHPEMRAFRLPDERMKQNLYNVLLNRSSPTPFMKSSFCSAHDRMYIFDAFADIYACWERTGDANIRIGSISPEGEIASNAPLLRQWRSRTAASNPICARCRYVLHCGGGCAVLAEAKHGRFFGNHCDAFGQRFRASAAGAYQALLAGHEMTQAPEAVCDL